MAHVRAQEVDLRIQNPNELLLTNAKRALKELAGTGGCRMLKRVCAQLERDSHALGMKNFYPGFLAGRTELKRLIDSGQANRGRIKKLLDAVCVFAQKELDEGRSRADSFLGTLLAPLNRNQWMFPTSSHGQGGWHTPKKNK